MQALSQLFGTKDNGWTGGQYSLFRLIFGCYLFIHFAHLVPWGAELFSSGGALADGTASPLLYAFPNLFAVLDAPWFVTAALVGAAGLSLAYAVGYHDRVAALLLWYLWACLFGRNPLISNPGLPYVGLLLFVHAFLPAAPYGSLARRGEVDPGGNWRMPDQLLTVVWVLMALGYTYSGYTKLVSPSWVNGSAVEMVLNNPLARPSFLRDILLSMPPLLLKLQTWGALSAEILFLPLAFFSRTRPLAWVGLLGMHLGLITLIDFADLSLGMVMLHLFTFNPVWVRGKTAAQADRVFYDGNCGLCHGAVRFLLAEDRDGAAFRFAPLDSDIFRAALPEEQRKIMPDSMVVLSADGEVLTKSRAWIRIMDRLGGVWRLFGICSRVIPQVVLDAVYDLVARVRGKLFKKPDDACPLLPRELRRRFDY